MHVLGIAIARPVDRARAAYSFDDRVRDLLEARLHLRAAVPAPARRGAVRPAQPVVDRGPRLRPRLPRAPRRAAGAGRAARARRVAADDRRPPARPHPPAVGAVRRRRARARPQSRSSPSAPLVDRRRVGRRADRALFDLEADPPPRADAAAPTSGSPITCRATPSCSATRSSSLAAAARRRSCRAGRPRCPVGVARVAGGRDEATRRRACRSPRRASSLNGTITPHRKIAFASVVARRREDGEERVRRHGQRRRARGRRPARCAATSSGRDELPDRPLVATIPTSVRTEDRRREIGNRVSAMFAALPVEIDDPVERAPRRRTAR